MLKTARPPMKIVYNIVGIAAAIAAIVVGILGMPGVMVVAFLLAIGLLFVANSDRIAKVRASATGFEAETRALIDEARATIDQLRIVGKIAVQANLSLVMRAGRWGGFSYDERERIRQVSLAALDQLGVSPNEREEIFEEWHTVTRFDYADWLLRHPIVRQKTGASDGLKAEWRALRGGGFENIPSFRTIELLLQKSAVVEDEVRQLLEDYRHYETHKQHRRPEMWKALVDRNR